jgi:hypothetical protein
MAKSFMRRARCDRSTLRKIERIVARGLYSTKRALSASYRREFSERLARHE